MAADDDELTPDEPEDELDEEDELEEEPDADELVDEDEVFGIEDDDDDTVVEETVDEDEDEEDEADEAATTRAKRRTGEEDEDEDDELLSPDDVEADLDRILKDRLVTADEEEDEDEEEPDERGETGDRLQPKRADEQLCPTCFLLVRSTAPGCPVGDDACPIFG